MLSSRYQRISWGVKSQDMNIDRRTSTPTGDVSEYLARLEVTGGRLTRNDLSGQDIVVPILDRGKMVLASLTSPELAH